MKNEKLKNILTTVIVAMLTSVVTANATGYLYKSTEVSFDKKNMNMTSTNVQGAIEELYESATDYSSLNTRVTSLESGKQNVFANNTLYSIGDDVKIGDKNVAGTLVVQGVNGNGNVQVNKTDGTKITSILDINNSLSTKAALASPTFTGTPKAPTASASTNNTQIATTAYVTTAVSNANTKTAANVTPKTGSGSIMYACFGNVCQAKVTNYNPGNLSARTTVASIPSGYRPPYETVQMGSTSCAMGVTSGGDLWLDAGCKNASWWISVTYPRWN